jgi:hypothetical protein
MPFSDYKAREGMRTWDGEKKSHERQGTRNTETKKTQEQREQKEENRELNPALV